ncbi:unnamed protein product [Microthlaspi erraticum]|uniref:Uncharacterized protein n=1 Tax=Microthlaspi erraticum TaxID=1685480 RepID=A0A6D2KH49_9BRAS|nr:unnamed protein product [Microthlaspi erraticum]
MISLSSKQQCLANNLETNVSFRSGYHTASSDFYFSAHHHADEAAATSHGLRSVERAECKDFYHNDHTTTHLEGCSGPHGSRSTSFLLESYFACISYPL